MTEKFSEMKARAFRYGVSVLSVAAALALSLLLWPWVEPHPTPLFLAAVALAAWRGGTGPSLLATLLAAGAIDYLFIPPYNALELSVSNAVRALVFVFVALLISRIDAARRRTLRERERLLAEAREARERAEAANRAKDQFLAAVTHELNAPLVVILGWVEILRSGFPVKQETVATALEKIERNALAQKRLVEDLLDVSRVATGKFHFDPRVTDLASVIEGAVEAVAPSARAKGVRLHAEYDWSAGPVCGDPGRLQQAVWNLLSNAVKFTPPGGRVDVWLERTDAHAQVTVSDTGRGIGAEFLPHVFDRFRQESEADAAERGGLGLGLTLVRHIVEMHGGAVRAESRGAGHGAAFVVRVPLIADDDLKALMKRLADGETVVEEELKAFARAHSCEPGKESGMSF